MFNSRSKDGFSYPNSTMAFIADINYDRRQAMEAQRMFDQSQKANPHYYRQDVTCDMLSCNQKIGFFYFLVLGCGIGGLISGIGIDSISGKIAVYVTFQLFPFFGACAFLAARAYSESKEKDPLLQKETKNTCDWLYFWRRNDTENSRQTNNLQQLTP